MIERFEDTEELLVLLNRYPQERSGFIDSANQFEYLLDQVHEWIDGLKGIEALEQRRYALVEIEGSRSSFALRYEESIRDFYQTLGYVQRGSSGTSHLFRYQPVEQVVTEDFLNRSMTDWVDVLAPLWPVVLGLKYFLEATYRSAQRHSYHPDPADMSVIFGWYTTVTRLGGANAVVPGKQISRQMEQYQRHFDQLALTKSAEEFVAKYITHPELVPIIVASDLGWHIDRPTTLLYALYLQSQLERHPEALEYRGRGVLDEARELAASAFEDWLRSELKRRGFRCLSHPLKLPGEKRTKYEYDIVALSEALNLVVIADAKYRDPSPSSLTGKTLVVQEFGGRDGLASHARRQQDRLEYLQHHVVDGLAYLQPERTPATYEIASYIVTKHVPLAHKYRDTLILRGVEFLEDLDARQSL